MRTDFFEKLENPFIIDIEDKEEYSYDEYIKIQEKLQEKNLDVFLEYLYPKENMSTTLEEIKRRTTRGLYQKIIDVSNNILFTKQVFKLGTGGDGKNCFVCCTPLFTDRHKASLSMRQSLEDVGFNGYFILLNGGFPNPTGTEMKYVGVPYSFKIFMMLEAKKMGFERVIWLDAACYAVNNPERLFDIVSEDDAIFRSFPPNCFSPNTCENIVFPKTIELLSNLVNRNIRDDTTINSIVFGLNFASPKINDFINEYYEMVKLGLPFLSSFPEEIVFTSIFNKPDYNYVFKNRGEMYKLYIHECYLNKEAAKHNGFYFVQRSY